MKTTEALLDACKEGGPEVSAAETKCMFMSRHQTGNQNHNIKVANNVKIKIQRLTMEVF